MEVFVNMQERLALRKTLKKVAAVGAGVAMMGMTMTGALAAEMDLAQYPSGLGFGGSDTVLVVGSAADAEDSIAATDIQGGLPQDSSTTTTSGSLVEGSTEAEVPISYNVAGGDRLSTELDDGDIDVLFDGVITFNSKEYDTSEKIIFSQTKNASVETSLTASEDDYQDGIYFHALRNSLYYLYSFDESLNVSDVSTDTPLDIKFLGKTLKIVNVDTTDKTKFTAYVGTEYYLNAGDSVVVEGKTVTLKSVASNNAVLVDVDGVIESISTGNTETVNGIEITNDEAFYTSAGTDQTSAALVIGVDSSDIFAVDEQYPGGDGVCNDENPADLDCWVWYTGSLGLKSTSTINNGLYAFNITGPYIAVRNDFNVNDDSDNPITVGECFDFPNNYISICMDSLTVDDDEYATYTMEYESNADFSSIPGVWQGQTSEPAIYIHTDVDEGIEVEYDNIAANRTITSDVKTKDVWMSLNDSNSTGVIDIFYKDTNNKKQYAGSADYAKIGRILLRVNYLDTKSSNVELRTGNAPDGGSTFTNATLIWTVTGKSTDALATGSDDIQTMWGISSNETTSLGVTGSSEEAIELKWGISNTTIGTKDEDHRSKYGIIIRDPKANGASDQVVVVVPGDQVLANVKVGAKAVEGGSSGVGSTTAAASMLDTELSDVSAYNVISVGGPAINQVSAQLMGLPFPSYGDDSGISPNEAVINLLSNGGNYAMVVAGYEALDTRRAGIVLKNYVEFASSLTGSGVVVKGTSLEVSGITVE